VTRYLSPRYLPADVRPAQRSPDVHARNARRRRAYALLALCATGAAVAAAPATSQAAVLTFGSQMSVPATMETAHSLSYPAGHDGADTALWNVSQAAGTPAAPADGQVLSLTLEGCAQPAPHGPSPLTQIHFQALVPQPGEAVRVAVTTQAFDIPVCGVNGASGMTKTTYQPINFCVARGDYVDLNDEGGFDPRSYPNGVPYQVIGSVTGSTVDSFIRSGGTNNGAILSPADTTSHDGFAANQGRELMLQARLGTGPDATPLCPGGTAGQAPTRARSRGPAVSLHPQTDGVNRRRYVRLALYCSQPRPCRGSVTLLSATGGSSASGQPMSLGGTTFTAPARRTAKVALRITPRALGLIRRRHGRLLARMSVRLHDGSRASQAVVLKI
jgi:hypothetical protein